MVREKDYDQLDNYFLLDEELSIVLAPRRHLSPFFPHQSRPRRKSNIPRISRTQFPPKRTTSLPKCSRI